ncbi:hypothetical protein Gotri_027472 [Gossypium trilobum]|uniref:Uncharacterized protein n=1 Tax=Gossypium trilobum TaxID=34281 RepID=A0A7J9FKU1_9ROSI|nr:hypothetical protein [Gossypium trilobum]
MVWRWCKEGNMTGYWYRQITWKLLELSRKHGRSGQIQQ